MYFNRTARCHLASWCTRFIIVACRIKTSFCVLVPEIAMQYMHNGQLLSFCCCIYAREKTHNVGLHLCCQFALPQNSCILHKSPSKNNVIKLDLWHWIADQCWLANSVKATSQWPGHFQVCFIEWRCSYLIVICLVNLWCQAPHNQNFQYI